MAAWRCCYVCASVYVREIIRVSGYVYGLCDFVFKQYLGYVCTTMYEYRRREEQVGRSNWG